MAVFVIIIWFMIVVGVIVWNVLQSNAKDPKMKESSYQDLLRYKTLDEFRRRCKDSISGGEVIYFTLDDIDRIIDEMKREQS